MNSREAELNAKTINLLAYALREFGPDAVIVIELAAKTVRAEKERTRVPSMGGLK